MNTIAANTQDNAIEVNLSTELLSLRGLDDIELLFVGGGDVAQMGG